MATSDPSTLPKPRATGGNGEARTFYYERDFGRNAVKILPGEYFVAGDDIAISTVLGSCVAACLWDRATGFGGMNHFMLPSRARRPDCEYDALLCGDYAMEVLVNAMFARGSRRERLVAKAFGGGNVVSHLKRSIGDGNIEFARTWLEREGIALHASDFGGPWARKVVCDVVRGEVFCRRIDCGQAASVSIVQEEEAYETALSRRTVAGSDDIELF